MSSQTNQAAAAKNKEAESASLFRNAVAFTLYTTPILVIALICADIFRKDYHLNDDSFTAKSRFYSNVHPNELFQNLTCDVTSKLDTKEQQNQQFANDNLSRNSNCFLRSRYCGRYFSDHILNHQHESSILQKLAKNGFGLIDKSFSEEGSAVYDFKSQVAYKNNEQLSLKSDNKDALYSPTDLNIYNIVRNKLLKHIQSKLDIEDLKLGNMELFIKLSANSTSLTHDQLVHKYVLPRNQEIGKSLHMVVLIFLSDHHFEFEGGRFIFNLNSDISHQLPENQKGRLFIDPKLGRILYFTTGHENDFTIEQVTESHSYVYATTVECL